MTSAEFHFLAERADVNGLVTRNACDVVVGWSKTVFDCLPFRKNGLVVFEPAVTASGRRARRCRLERRSPRRGRLACLFGPPAVGVLFEAKTIAIFLVRASNECAGSRTGSPLP